MQDRSKASPGTRDGLTSNQTRTALSELARSVPVALAIVLGIAIVFRLIMTVDYDPAVLSFADTSGYVGMANLGLFSDAARPVGYSVFLRAVHLISANVELTIAIQHLMGLATGVLMYAIVRRVGGPVWVAVLAAASVLLSLDQVFLEHTLASETLFTFLFAAALLCAVCALREPRQLRGAISTRQGWLIAASVLLGLSAVVRGISAPMVPFFAVWALVVFGAGWRPRLTAGALAAVPAVLVLCAYSFAHERQTGVFGLNQMSGWATYARAAQFADCARFDPPAGTERLCETKPPSERPGPDFYSWQPESPAQRLFGYPPAGNEQLAEFGRAAILAQPLDYAEAVVSDIGRYFVPTINQDRPYGGTDYRYLSIDHREPPIEQDITERVFNPYYLDDDLEIGSGAVWLGDLQAVLRVHPILLLQALVLAGVGAWFARGSVRAAIVLLAGSGLLTILIAAAISTYNARYVIPVDGPVIAAGLLGLWVLVARRSGRDGRREPGAYAGESSPG